LCTWATEFSIAKLPDMLVGLLPLSQFFSMRLTGLRVT
jgi:hypothetical protein